MSTPPQIKYKIEQKTLETSAHMTLSLWGRAKRTWFRWAEMNQHSSWFPYFIAFVVGLDAMVILLPGDIIVVLAVLSNPGAWRKTMFSAGIGGALGGFLCFMLVRETGGQFLDELQSLNATLGMAGNWEHARGFFRDHGLSSLLIGSVIPGFSYPPVILAGLAKAPAFPVLGYLVAGRLLRYLILCYGVRYGWAFFQTVRNEAREERAKALLEHPKDPPAK